MRKGMEERSATVVLRHGAAPWSNPWRGCGEAVGTPGSQLVKPWHPYACSPMSCSVVWPEFERTENVWEYVFHSWERTAQPFA